MFNGQSSIQTVLALLRDTASRVPATPCTYPLQEPSFGTGVAEEDIQSLETAIKSPLPNDFLEFQRTCGSILAMDVWNGYCLMEAPHIEALYRDPYSPITGSVHDKSPIIPIGGDGGGNMFHMATGASNEISKWNHEADTAEKVADNFTEFLQRLLEDWQHFVAQDGAWKYMAGSI
jgi:hypothetical protein